MPAASAGTQEDEKETGLLLSHLAHDLDKIRLGLRYQVTGNDERDLAIHS